jgi:hypothetical protein
MQSPRQVSSAVQFTSTQRSLGKFSREKREIWEVGKIVTVSLQFSD